MVAPQSASGLVGTERRHRGGIPGGPGAAFDRATTRAPALPTGKARTHRDIATNSTTAPDITACPWEISPVADVLDELRARVEKLEREVRDLRDRLRSGARWPGDRWAATG